MQWKNTGFILRGNDKIDKTKTGFFVIPILNFSKRKLKKICYNPSDETLLNLTERVFNMYEMYHSEAFENAFATSIE